MHRNEWNHSSNSTGIRSCKVIKSIFRLSLSIFHLHVKKRTNKTVSKANRSRTLRWASNLLLSSNFLIKPVIKSQRTEVHTSSDVICSVNWFTWSGRSSFMSSWWQLDLVTSNEMSALSSACCIGRVDRSTARPQGTTLLHCAQQEVRADALA